MIPPAEWRRTLVAQLHITAEREISGDKARNETEGVERPINFHKHGIKYYDYGKS